MKKKGISLIVLSITILVMAILAATVIIALEDSGIIGRSKNTVKNNNYVDEYTRLAVIKNGILTDNLGTITVDEYITELQNKGIIESSIITNADGSKTVTTKTGFTVVVSQNGTSDLGIVIDGYTPPTNNNSGSNTGNGNSGDSGNNDGTTQKYTLSGKWKLATSLSLITTEQNINFTYYYENTSSYRTGTNITIDAVNKMMYYSGSTVYDDGWIGGSNIDFGTASQEVSEKFYNWFIANATQQTSSKITFTIDGMQYQADAGMIWADWLSSSYNTDGFKAEVGNNDVISPDYIYVYNPDLDFDGRLFDKQIINGADYYIARTYRFYINYMGTEDEYFFQRKMTWEDFINSGFNSGTLEIVDDMYIKYIGPRLFLNGTMVLKTDEIVIDALYTAGSGECCFDPKTQILMADGTTKNIEDVRIGDMVMSLNEDTGKYIAQKVINTIIKHNSDDLVYVNLSNGVRLGMRAYHPLLTTEGWKSLRPDFVETQLDVGDVELLKVGDTLVGYDGNVTIVSIETREDILNYDTFNLSVEGYHNYIANGVVAHNLALCDLPM